MRHVNRLCRVSTDKNLDLQRDALNKISCKKIFEDKASGAKDNRLNFLREGEDTLVVWRLDRPAH